MSEIDRREYSGGFPVPGGRITSRLIDLSASIGLAYERSIKYEKDLHAHDRVNLTFPCGSSRLFFETTSPKRRWIVDRTAFLWMPAGVAHRQGASSLVWENFALFPGPRAIRTSLSRQARVSAKPGSRLNRIGVYQRSELLDQLVQRLFHERVVLGVRQCKMLTQAILDEALRIVVVGAGTRDRSLSKKALNEPAVDLAIRFLETNLFSSVSAKDLAEAARTSVATLYRQFRNELKMAPQEYQRLRRMDESVELLATGDYTISDVAILVGYEEVAAFSKAFKRRFGHSPSRLKRAKKQ